MRALHFIGYWLLVAISSSIAFGSLCFALVHEVTWGIGEWVRDAAQPLRHGKSGWQKKTWH